MAVTLSKTGQIGIKIEASEGAEETLTAPEFSGNRKRLSETGAEVNRYARELERASFSQLEDLPGQRLGRVKFVEELVGGGASTAAPWHTTLRGLGFAATGLKVISVGTITNGPFKIGQTIGDNATQGSATKTGVIVKQLTGKLVYRPVTGTFGNTDTIYNYASPQASCTASSAASAAGYQFAPITETDSGGPPSVTVEKRIGGLRYTLVGARGSGSLACKLGEPLLLTAEFRGPQVFDTDGVTPRAGAVVTGLTAYADPPKVAKGIALTLRAGATDYTPILTELGLDLGNVLAPRPTIAGDLVSSGYLATRIADRKPVVSVDPEAVAPGTFNFQGRIVGGTTFELFYEVGGVAEANGLVIVHGPRAQLTGDLEFGDREGIQTIPTKANLCGSSDDELFVSHVFVP